MKNKSLITLLSKEINNLEYLGWHVILKDSEIAIHRSFKNGKIKKIHTIGITKYEENQLRPWYVCGPSLFQAHTFSEANNAVKLYMDQARKHSPNRKLELK